MGTVEDVVSKGQEPEIPLQARFSPGRKGAGTPL